MVENQLARRDVGLTHRCICSILWGDIKLLSLTER